MALLAASVVDVAADLVGVVVNSVVVVDIVVVVVMALIVVTGHIMFSCGQ